MLNRFDSISFRVFLLILGIVIGSQIAAKLFRDKAEHKGIEMLSPLNTSSQSELITLKDYTTLKEEDFNKLISLSKIIEGRKNHHKIVFLELYKYHFASVSILLILSAISIVVIFLVSQSGLANCSPYLKTTFFTLAALTSFYALSPIVYKQDLTINRNLNSYVNYDNLQGNIYNYALTKPNVTTTFDSLKFFVFHSSIVKSMSDLNNISLDFDYKSIENPDFFKNVSTVSEINKSK